MFADGRPAQHGIVVMDYSMAITPSIDLVSSLPKSKAEPLTLGICVEEMNGTPIYYISTKTGKVN